MHGVLVLDFESTKHSVKFIPSWEECQYSTKSLLANPQMDGAPVLHFRVPGYSCLPHLWVWLVGSKMSSQMLGPKWLTSSPTAHQKPQFRASIPHTSHISHNPAQHIHGTTQPWPVCVQTCLTRNNTHMWYVQGCFKPIPNIPEKAVHFRPALPRDTRKLFEPAA